MEKEEIFELPLLPLRSEVLLPYQVLAIRAGREISVNAIEAGAKKTHKLIFAVQKNPQDEDITIDNIYPIATSAEWGILQKDNDFTKLLTHGQDRVKILELTLTGDPPYWLAKIQMVKANQSFKISDSPKAAALKNIFQEYVEGNGPLTENAPNALNEITQTNDVSKLIDLISGIAAFDDDFKNSILQELDINTRLDMCLKAVSEKFESIKIRNNVQKETMQNLGMAQKEMIIRTQMQELQKELDKITGENNDQEDIIAKLQGLEIDEKYKVKLIKEANRISSIPNMSPEVGMVKNYLTWVTELPWGKAEFKPVDIHQAKEILDRDHYGLEKVKQRILEWIAVQQRAALLNAQGTDTPKTPILCLVGPPGVGKTSLGKSIATALNRELGRLSLGGVRDEAEIRGHRRTYVGALPGRIIQTIKQLGVINPVLMLDEIDKIGADYRGDPESALLEVLDPEQNSAFIDHFLEIPYDLSQVLFITTANLIETISPPLRDRMEIINISGYTEEEKHQIAIKYLLPKQLKLHAVTQENILLPDDLILKIIRGYTREAGVRELERQIATVIRKIPRMLMENPNLKQVTITEDNLLEYLGPVKFLETKTAPEDLIGIANGVTVSQYGGDVISVEAIAIPETTGITLTGHLGDIMKESAIAALSWAKVNGAAYGVAPGFYNTHGIHIHVPEGAIPKDGPSAGISILATMISVGSNRPIRKDVAMTGEITLRGQILPIGGVRDKLLAAHRMGIKHFLLPEGNSRDLYEIDKNLLSDLEIHLVAKVQDALDIILMPQIPTTPKHIGFSSHSFGENSLIQ